MATLEQISFAFNKKHRKDRGIIVKNIATGIKLGTQQVHARLRGDVPIADDEMPIFLEELKLPKGE